MKTKLTAVEWLIEQVKSPSWSGLFIWHKEEIFQQVLVMEKEQIMDAVNYGCSDFGSVKNAEQYYTETYNK
jgi:hypothetical protein